jgi:hypothetical protein
LKSPVCRTRPAGVEWAQLLVLALPDGERVRRDAVFLEFRLDQRERQRRADERDVLPQLEQVGNRADVVLVAVGEDNSDDVIEPIPDGREVRQDQVDARLGLLGKEHAAVDDENLAVELIRGHVATDLAEAADRDDPECSWGEFGWLVDVYWHRVLWVETARPSASG